jgi:hypothetical protein
MDYDDESPDSIKNAMYITIVGLIFIVLFVASILSYWVKNSSLKYAGILGILATICMFIAPVYVAVSLPGEFDDTWASDLFGENYKEGPNKSFFGSFSLEDKRVSWGGTYGWFLSIIAFVFALIGTATCFIPWKKPLDSGEEHT